MENGWAERLRSAPQPRSKSESGNCRRLGCPGRPAPPPNSPRRPVRHSALRRRHRPDPPGPPRLPSRRQQPHHPGPLSDDEIGRLERLDPEIADLIRAQSFLTAGRVNQAQILARRYPASDGALQIRVGCLLSQGRTSDAIEALESDAGRNGDERFVLQAALLALSAGAGEDASRLAAQIASSNDPYRRRIGREILIETASRREDWQAVLAEAPTPRRRGSL